MISGILTEVIFDLVAALQIELRGSFILLKRYMEEHERINGMSSIFIQTLDLLGIPIDLIVMDIVIDIYPLTCVCVGVDKEQPRIKRTVRIPELDELIISSHDIRLYIGI